MIFSLGGYYLVCPNYFVQVLFLVEVYMLKAVSYTLYINQTKWRSHLLCWKFYLQILYTDNTVTLIIGTLFSRIQHKLPRGLKYSDLCPNSQLPLSVGSLECLTLKNYFSNTHRIIYEVTIPFGPRV